MRHVQFWTGLSVTVATLGGTAFAEVRTGSRLPVDAATLPRECRQFLEIPANALADWPFWAGRLSVAACRQGSIAIAPVTDPEKLRGTIAALEHAVEPSVAIYKDAMANGPIQIRMLAAYWLGMTYTNVAIRARAAIPTGGDIMSDLTLADRYLTLHRTIEPLLANERALALAAFEEGVRLADSDPTRATGNQMMSNVTASVRAAVAGLH